MGILKNAAMTAAIASLAATALPSAAEPVEKIVVTGNRIGQTAEDRLGTSVSVVTANDMKDRQTLYVADVLRDVPGLAVARTGGPGGVTQVRTRGSEGNHTLVLLDGAEANDPFQGEFDFAGLLAGDIARIEVLRGSQSALYGSDAIGGVINIIPRRGNGDLAVSAEAEAGSFSTTRASLAAAFGNDVFDIYASTTAHGTAGTNIARNGREADGARERSYFVNTGVRLAPDIELRAFIRQVLTRAEGDPQDFAFLSPTQGLAIDGDEVTRTSSLYGNVQLETRGLGDRLATRLSYSFTDGSRFNYADSAPSFITEGHRDKLSGVTALDIVTGETTHRLTGAIDWKEETYRNVAIGAPTPVNDLRRVQNMGVVASYDVSHGAFDAGAAIRLDRNDLFQDATTWRLQASYRVGDTRLRATSGSGIKNPNNFELFGFDPSSFIGNPSLKPERSVGWDIGVDQYLMERRLKLSATWFDATLEDEIWTDFIPPLFVATTKNRTTQSHRRGLELAAIADVGDWSIDASYTFTDAEENGLEEVRRPRHMAALNASYSLDAGTRLGIGVHYTGRREDNEFIFATPGDVVTLDAVTLVNLYAAHQLTDRLEAFARVENVFDETYEDVFSFTSPGLSAYAGLRFTM